MDDRWKQIRALVLPVTAALIVPFLIAASWPPFRLQAALPYPWLQIPLGAALLLVGLVLLAQTIRLFSRVGRGTLAPWDPPRHLVVRGPYRYVRNPMISGVLFIILGEAVLLASRGVLIWFALFWLINTTYFKLLEEPGLVRRFGGEYTTYRAHVPMWIPRRKPWDPPQAK